jgi:hypothetical protein
MIYGVLTLALIVVAQAVVNAHQERDIRRLQWETRVLRQVLAWEGDALDELL